MQQEVPHHCEKEKLFFFFGSAVLMHFFFFSVLFFPDFFIEKRNRIFLLCLEGCYRVSGMLNVIAIVASLGGLFLVFFSIGISAFVQEKRERPWRKLRARVEMELLSSERKLVAHFSDPTLKRVHGEVAAASPSDAMGSGVVAAVYYKSWMNDGRTKQSRVWSDDIGAAARRLMSYETFFLRLNCWTPVLHVEHAVWRLRACHGALCLEVDASLGKPSAEAAQQQHTRSLAAGADGAIDNLKLLMRMRSFRAKRSTA